jgi:DNA (cytosine-5)-methyltransferase 1
VLRKLIAKNIIAPGDVDGRSIKEVKPDEVKGYRQVHLFAGAGGWSLAARIAGWEDSQELWTGSPPCQPFSRVGRKKGAHDARHLWPHFYRLADARRPSLIVGEQVAGAAGGDWFDGVASDLEGIGYACRAFNIAACSVNAPHIRQRLYWIATTDGLLAHASGYTCRSPSRRIGLERGLEERRSELGKGDDQPVVSSSSPWQGAEWRAGTDGKNRRTQSGLHLVVDGFPGGLDAIRLIGNSIVPSLAAQVLGAILDVSGR